MFRRKFAISMLCLSVPIIMTAQSSNGFNSMRNGFGNSGGGAFNSSRANSFNDQRMKLSVEYIKMTREDWRSFNSSREVIPPIEDVKPVTPIRISDEDLQKENKDRKIEIETVVSPTIQRGGAKPVAPIEEVEEDSPAYLTFSFYNTPIRIRKPATALPYVKSASESSVADMLERLNTREFSNMLYDCVGAKKAYRLDDWPYFLAMKEFAESVYGSGTNESAILTAYILSQAGYKIRLARGANGKLCVMYASRHQIYRQPYINIDNDYYYFLGQSQQQAEICPAYFSSEKPLSLWITSTPTLESDNSQRRQLKSERYPDFDFSIAADKNLVKLLDTYPASEIGGDFMTRWAMYASTPISENVKTDLYVKMRSLISGMTKVEATERILNWVQTSLVYEYDDKVWGMDRAFFAEETLYYPYADCEDRAILFTRIVRDLLGLECMLVYYPGHLASAVLFDVNVSGDYIEYRGKRYTVCDPTYIGAQIGMTMNGMDNSKAKVVVLGK